MIAAWMLYSTAIGALAGAAALAGHHVCRMLRVPGRWVWAGAMVVTIALSSAALVELAMPEPPLPAAVVAAGDMERAPVAPATPLDGFAALVRNAGAMVGSGIARVYVAAARTAPGGGAMFGAWLIATTALFALLFGTLLRLRVARKRWTAHRIADVPVLVSRDTGPALVGLRRPSIVLPAWLLAEPEDRQRLVVQHEDEHRRAGDHMLLTVACVIVCLMPWNAALWWMLLRLRLAVELDCDARVLRGGVKPRSYGSLLLEIAGRTRSRPFGAPALADSATHLERRLIAMTERNHTPRRMRVAAGAMSALLLVAAACTTELPTAAAIDEMDVEQAQVRAESAGLLRSSTDQAPLFIVDGVVMGEDAAKEIASMEIGSIEVIRGPAAVDTYGERAAHGVVVIRTRSADGDDAATQDGRVRVRSSEAGMPLGEPLERTSIVVRRSAGDTVTMRGELRLREGPEAPPLFIVDGVIAGDSFSLNSLSPESIERIEVVKGAAARRLYSDARALNGVIRITTKGGGR